MNCKLYVQFNSENAYSMKCSIIREGHDILFYAGPAPLNFCPVDLSVIQSGRRIFTRGRQRKMSVLALWNSALRTPFRRFHRVNLCSPRR